MASTVATSSASEPVAGRSPATGAPAAEGPVETVGFIGLGHMGGAMAQRLVDAGWATVLWARRPEVLDAFSAANVEVAATPAALAAAADLVGVCVWADDDVREVVAGEDGLLAGSRPGTVIVIHSTVEPATCRALAALAAARGVALLDAPVSGGRDVALEGKLTVAVGGDLQTLQRCRPVLAAFADTVVALGDVGAGQVAKLLNNALLAANLTVADDALTLGEALGLDPVALAPFLADGSGRSYGLGVAARARTTPATRQAARPALDKDLSRLRAAMAPDGADAGAAVDDPTPLLRDAAEAIRRLGDPPPGWA